MHRRYAPATRAGTWLFAVGLASFAGVQCDCRDGAEPESAQRTSPDADSPGWAVDARAFRELPASAPAVGLFRRCSDLASLADWVERRRHATDRGVDNGEPSRDTGDADELDAETAGSARPATFVDTLRDAGPTGLDASRPCALYRRPGRWGFAGEVADDEALGSWLNRAAGTPRVERSERDDGTATYRVSLGGVSGTDRRVGVDRRGGMLRAETRPADGTDTADPTEAGTAESTETSARRRRLLDRAVTESDHFAALVDPEPLLADAELRPRAESLLERMLPQFGPVAFGAGLREEPRRLEGRLLARSPPDEPVAVESLGVATGDVPPVGGLVEPGVLGVLHLSVDPVRLYKMLVAMLPARQRRQLRAFWDQMRSKLLVNRPREIVGDFTGRALVVFYGLEGKALEASGAQLAARLARLDMTREAVLLPIEQRETVEQALDKLTQISKGRLSRQQGEHTIQYAWLEEGRLEWAVVLGDDHLVAVDSPTAFDRAMAYERRGHRLEKSTRRKMGIGPLLDRPDQSGIYLDTRTIARLLRENGRPAVARWLRPFQSALVTTQMKPKDHVSRTAIRLRLDAP